MIDINNLKINKWYKDRNILFMPKKKLDMHPYASHFGRYDDGAYELTFVQDVRHMGLYIYNSNVLYEIHNIESQGGMGERHYLYNDDSQKTIEVEDIETPKQKDFRNVIESIFENVEESKWRKMKK